MSFKPTKSQENIINSKNNGIIVSASAGSGKTSTMIARITRLIKENKVNPERILVLTFANAAASDMRAKLIENLQHEGESDRDAYNSIFDLANANICTIDSFCQNLLRTYFYEVQIDPAFAVVDDASKNLLMEKAFNNIVVKLWLKEDKVLNNLINTYSEKRKLDELKSIIFSVYNHFCVSDNYKNLLNLTEESFNENLTKNLAASLYVKYVSEKIESINLSFFDIKNNLVFEESKGYLKLVLEEINNLKQNNFTQLRNKALLYKSVSKPSTKNNENLESEVKELIKSIKLYLDDVKDIVEFAKRSDDEINRVQSLAKVTAQNLFVLTEQFSKEYFSLKQEKFMLDFSDIQNLAFKILLNKEIQNEVSNKFDYVFIDEFQDINELQGEFINLIANENKKFAVGDAKQSIYGFRLTSPQIFLANFEKALIKNSKVNAEVLQKNFRSTNSILYYINYIFENIMTKQTSSMDFDEKAKFALDDDINFDCDVSVCIFDKADEEEKPLDKVYSLLDSQTDEDENAIKEASKIANIVIENLTNGYEESDIAILCRSKSQKIKTIAKTLSNLGFAINLDFEEDIIGTKETIAINNFIYLLSNYKNDINLASTMTTFFEFNENELADIRLTAKGKRFFYEAVDLCRENTEFSDKINNMFLKIEKIRRFCQNHNVFEVALSIVLEYNVEEKVYAMQNGDIDNLTKYLLELSKMNIDVFEYTYLTTDTKYKVKPSGGKSSKITISTIHASKGLEYKVVILVDASKRFNMNDKQAKVIIEKEIGICPSGINTISEEVEASLAKEVAAKLKEKESFSDELRLLYVALTRAQKKLYCIGEIDFSHYKKPNSQYEITKCKSYLELLLSPLSLEKINVLQNEKICYLKNENFQTYAKYEVCEFNKSEIKSNVFVLPKADSDLVESIQKLPSKISTINVPLKNTVTRILENENSQKIFLSNSFSEEERINKILEGNAYHRFFELFNIDKLNLLDEVERVLNELRENERRFLNKDILNNFTKSELINILKSGKLLKEQKFVFKSKQSELGQKGEDEILVQGIIDACVVQEDGVIIIDYKTSNASAEELKKRYRTQLELYGHAVSKILRKTVKKIIIYSVFNTKIIEI